MNFTKLEIPDVILFEPKIFGDDRGFFYESYREKVFRENGIQESFIQDNHVGSAKGVVRGLHYQLEPMAQAKLVRAVKGSIYDVVVDIRQGSPTFGKHVGVELSAEKRNILFVPKGFAHGYCSLSDDSEVLYKVSNVYSPEHEQGILWNDPALGIDWPKLDCDYILSPKDKEYPLLEKAALFTA